MLIEALVVSVNYGDYLRHTLPTLLPHVDHVIVATTERDDETHQVCAQLGVSVVKTPRFHLEGAPFNKGCGINDSLAKLSRSDWILLLDADIVLPRDFRRRIDRSALDRETLYGARRRLCSSHHDWEEHVSSGSAAAGFPLHPLVRKPGLGYLPSGYFQLFHAQARALRGMTKWYSEGWRYADKSDMWFSERWTRRALLRGIDVIHLDEGSYLAGRNWLGRMSARFGQPIGDRIGAV